MPTADPVEPHTVTPGTEARPQVDTIVEAKLHWPPGRDDWVRRERLIDQMHRATRHQVTLVAAPAGYGKTILVAQWLGSEQRPPAAWVSIDPGDNDPNRLWAHVAVALARAGCALPVSLSDRTGSAVPGTLLPAIVNALAATPDEIVIVLDDFHFIRDAACHDQVEFLVDNLPARAHLVIITRADPGLRLGRLRASGGLAEIRADDLCFTAEEAAALLEHEDVHLSDRSLGQLMQRTEGWPAGLYLATLSLADRSDPDEFVRAFSGGNRFVGDYLTEEVLSRHSPEVREFITSISILDRFSASLCDHVVGTTASATLLHDLSRTNLFVVPLGDEGVWFRFHHLFAAVARSELEITHPERVRSLHARAAEWFRDHGHIDEAVQHSLAADDAEAASLLVQGNWLAYVDAGRAATVRGWLDAIDASAAIPDPAANVTAAWLAALAGNQTALAARLTALEGFHDRGPLPDGTRTVESGIAMIQALFGFDGPVEMLRNAQRAVALETDRHSPFFAVAQATLGHAYYVAGDLDQALTHLLETSHNDRAPKIIRALSLSTESLVEAERGDLTRSRECAELAMDIIEGEGLRAMPQASLAYTAFGQAQAAAGKTEEALATLDRGLVLRRESSAHGPWGMIHHLLATARVAAEAGRLPQARELLIELGPRLAAYSDGMDAMHARLAAVQRLVHTEAAAVEGDPLTGRELDILRLLQGPMSLQQIAGELYLSFNTVKTHTRAVYRKLGAHTRSDAVRTGRRQHLI